MTDLPMKVPWEAVESSDWFQSRPPEIQALCRATPPGVYRVREGAPYAISAPGSVGYVDGYQENGCVLFTTVIYSASGSLGYAARRAELGRDDLPEDPPRLRASVDPAWLEPYDPSPSTDPKPRN